MKRRDFLIASVLATPSFHYLLKKHYELKKNHSSITSNSDYIFIKTYLKNVFPDNSLISTLEKPYENIFNTNQLNINLLSKQAFGLPIAELRNTKPSQAAELFNHRRIEDFNNLNLVEIDGWILSSSEQAIFALFTFS